MSWQTHLPLVTQLRRMLVRLSGMVSTGRAQGSILLYGILTGTAPHPGSSASIAAALSLLLAPGGEPEIAPQTLLFISADWGNQNIKGNGLPYGVFMGMLRGLLAHLGNICEA